jgi:hypothetical protein
MIDLNKSGVILITTNYININEKYYISNITLIFYRSAKKFAH